MTNNRFVELFLQKAQRDLLLEKVKYQNVTQLFGNEKVFDFDIKNSI